MTSRRLPTGWQQIPLEELVQPFPGHWGMDVQAEGLTPAQVLGVGNVLNDGNLDVESVPVRYLAQSELECIAQEGDLLVVKSSGSATNIRSGKTAICPHELTGRIACSNFMMLLRPAKDKVEPRWLWRYLNGRDAKAFVQLIAGSSTYPNIKWSSYKNLLVPVPPLHNQQRIVAKLDKQMAALDRAEKALAEQQTAASALWQAELEAVFDLAANPAWSQVRLGDVAELNPRRPVLHRSDAAPTTFVPMSAIDSLAGTITGSEKRQYGDVKKGYTYFAEGDVLFAKITPCMQNGKHAVASDLVDGIGFGSTEFHVIRPSSALTAEWLHLFVRQQNVLQRAVAHFTGAVGQQRVPQDYVESLILPLPPVSEQVFLSEHLTEIRAQLSALKTALENNNAVLGQLRSRLLDAAFSGEA